MYDELLEQKRKRKKNVQYQWKKGQMIWADLNKRSRYKCSMNIHEIFRPYLWKKGDLEQHWNGVYLCVSFVNPTREYSRYTNVLFTSMWQWEFSFLEVQMELSSPRTIK